MSVESTGTSKNRLEEFGPAFPVVHKAVEAFFEGLPAQFERLERQIPYAGIFGFDALGTSTLFRPDPDRPKTNESLAESIRAFARSSDSLAIVVVFEARAERRDGAPPQRVMFALVESATGERTLSVWPILESDGTTELGERRCGPGVGPLSDSLANLIPDKADIPSNGLGQRPVEIPLDIRGVTFERALAKVSAAFGGAALPRPHTAEVLRMFRASDRFDLLILARERTSLKPQEVYLVARPSGQVLGITSRTPGADEPRPTIILKRYASVKKLLSRHPSLKKMLNGARPRD